nr:hypothetical protein [Tanacetum cinerariifolium]
MECVTTTSFSISINGSLHGYFKGKRGLRQGDPLSPYLFTLVMEILTLILRRRVRASSEFTFHMYCSKLNLINLCFADDLFLFTHGDMDSARVIMESLEEFKNVYGLVPSLPKSTAYFCNVLNYVKLGILNILPFEEDKLPVKYLGVPLVPSRLVHRDCQELLERVKHRVNDWKNKYLSFVGRAQLIRSVLSDMKKGKAKVAWEVVCLPKKEGGLGIRRLDIFNKALIASHIWSILSGKDLLWVKYSCLSNINGPNLSATSDSIVVRDLLHKEVNFSVFAIWGCIRTRNNKVAWYNVVWFPQQIPRYATHLWLVMKRKLKTQDLMRTWDLIDPNVNLMCPFCNTTPDFHEHLFFACSFSHRVWELVKDFTGVSNIPSDLDAITNCIISMDSCGSLKAVDVKPENLLANGRIEDCQGGLDYFQWLALCFCNSWSCGPPCCKFTLDSARSCVMKDAFLTQGTVSSILIVLSWGGSIRPKGFLSFILLWLVIIVAVVGGGVTIVVVVVESSSVVKLSFVIT